MSGVPVVKAQIRLLFHKGNDEPAMVIRSFQLTQKAGEKREFKVQTTTTNKQTTKQKTLVNMHFLCSLHDVNWWYLMITNNNISTGTNNLQQTTHAHLFLDVHHAFCLCWLHDDGYLITWCATHAVFYPCCFILNL